MAMLTSEIILSRSGAQNKYLLWMTEAHFLSEMRVVAERARLCCLIGVLPEDFWD